MFVVDDEDVDPFNIDDVLWAFSTRFRGMEDLIISERNYGSPLDPSSNPKGLVTRLGFDLTRPLPPDTPMNSGPVVKGWPQSKDWQAVIKGYLAKKPVELPRSEPAVRTSKSCPRCGHNTHVVLGENNYWQLYKCKDCSYVWRNSEEDQFMDHKLTNAELSQILYHPHEKFGKS